MEPQPQPNLMKGIAPIFGKDLCCFIGAGAHLRLPLAGIGSNLVNGFFLLVDIQPEGTTPSVLMGTGVSGKTSLIVHYNEDGVKNRIRCDIQDDNQQTLSARAQLSKYAAKRVFINANVRSREVNFYEFNIHSADKIDVVEYPMFDAPNSFSEFSYDMMLGGACIDGERLGSISTKIDNFAIWKAPVAEHEIFGLIEASQNDLRSFYGDHIYTVDESAERRALFRHDMGRMRRWGAQETLSGADTGDAANMLYRWLFDKHPMLQDLCNELGIQLTFPGETDQRRDCYKLDIVKKADMLMLLAQGKRHLGGYQWVPRMTLASDLVVMFSGTDVTVESFVKLVRHKLGGGHFDVENRRKWQRKVAAMSRYLDDNRDWLNHHMKALLGAVWEGIVENRIEQHTEK
jgi:hypothetical protein